MVGPVSNELADFSKWYRQQHWQLAVTEPHSRDRKAKPSLSPCYTQSMSLVTKEAGHTQPNMCPDTWQHQFCRTWICITPTPPPLPVCCLHHIWRGCTFRLFLHWVLSYNSDSQSLVPAPVGSRSPGKLLEMQVLRPHLLNQTFWGWSQQSVF